MSASDSQVSPISTTQASQLILQHYGLKGQLEVLPGEADYNFKFQTDTKAYIFKVSQPGDQAKNLQLQSALLQHLKSKQLPVQLPFPQADLQGHPIVPLQGALAGYFTCLLDWIPGRLLGHLSHHSLELLASIGESCGWLCRGLKDFEHPRAHRSFKWNLPEGGWIKNHREALTEAAHKELFDYFLDLFEQAVEPKLDTLRQQLIYNDANDYNLLVQGPLGQERIGGAVDFGDAVHAPIVCDLAIACAYAAMGKNDPMAAT
ncbi:MAG: phosphotransferase, partial [Bacteroidota bacterium]